MSELLEAQGKERNEAVPDSTVIHNKKVANVREASWAYVKDYTRKHTEAHGDIASYLVKYLSDPPMKRRKRKGVERSPEVEPEVERPSAAPGSSSSGTFATVGGSSGPGSVTLETWLKVEKRIRHEHMWDVPDSDGSEPFIFSIGEQHLQATNRKRATWNQILRFPGREYRKKDFTGDLHQQFADLKEWLESVWRGKAARAVPTREALVAMASSVNVFDGLW